MSEIEELKEQIKALTDELASLKEEGVAKAFKEEETLDNMEEKLKTSKDDALKMAEVLEEEIKKSPLKSLVIALSVGFIAAKVLR